MAPRNLAAYVDLAKRLERQGDAAEPERARTSLVEPMPNEAEGHRELARIREAAGRWDLAVVQWAHVVRTRSLEPDGRLSLARARIEAGDRTGARADLEKVLSGTWDARFGDVKAEAARLLERLR
jgi:hypothetical protein